jgi:hypothetical protein
MKQTDWNPWVTTRGSNFTYWVKQKRKVVTVLDQLSIVP